MRIRLIQIELVADNEDDDDTSLHNVFGETHSLIPAVGSRPDMMTGAVVSS